MSNVQAPAKSFLFRSTHNTLTQAAYKDIGFISHASVSGVFSEDFLEAGLAEYCRLDTVVQPRAYVCL